MLSVPIRVSLGVLVTWTLFVWVGRLRNIRADQVLSGGELVWRLGLAISFVILAVAVAILAFTPARVWLLRVVRALAVWGILVWAVRGVSIALADHSLGFILVHTVLAIVTIVLSLWTLHSIRGLSPSTIGSN